jgi:hypothetical protein
MLLRQQDARCVDITAGDMAMDINCPGHDNLSRHVVFQIRGKVIPLIVSNPAILDGEISYLATPIL